MENQNQTSTQPESQTAFLVGYLNSQAPHLGDAFLAYEKLEQVGLKEFCSSSEVHDRLIHDAAYIEGSKVFCKIHEVELDEEGSCPHCEEAMNQVGMDMAEARAMRLADIVNETTDDTPLEENLPYYAETDQPQQEKKVVTCNCIRDCCCTFQRSQFGSGLPLECTQPAYHRDDGRCFMA